MGMNFDFKKLKPYKPEIAIVMTGLVLMLIGNILGASGNDGRSGNTETNVRTPVSISPEPSLKSGGYAEYYASQIEALLESMDGISSVKAAVYVKSEGSGVLAENSQKDSSVINEADSQGGTREEHKDVSDRNVVILKDSAGNESVVYLSQSAPEIAGIAVSVKGGVSAVTEEKIKMTLMALYDIPASKISITG